MKRLLSVVLALVLALGLSITASALSVTVRIPTGEDVTLHVNPGTDRDDMIDMVCESEDISTYDLRLLYGNRLLAEEDTADSLGLKDGDMLYLLTEYSWDARYNDRYDEDDEHALWVDTLLEIENSKPVDALHVNIKSYDKVPVYILEGLAGRGISLELIPAWGDSLTIRSDDVIPNWYGVGWYTLDELWDLYG